MSDYMPCRRDSGFTAQQVGAEVVVYNAISGKAVCLNPVAAAVWELCDGRNTPEMMARAATVRLREPVSQDVVDFALMELNRKGLLEKRDQQLTRGLSRRDLVRKLGLRAAVLLPVVGMIAVPRKAHAY